jgi:hypothetical protein
MTTTIDNSFIKHFEADVHNAYQQQGSKLQSTVRSKSGIKGASTTFQVIGTATAGTKTRNGQIATADITHVPVECMLTDYYCGQWVDSLDELKLGHDERKVLAQAGAYALGRKTDELIINALNGATQSIGEGTLTKERIMQAFTVLNKNDVPDDGERYGLLSPDAWNQLMSIEEFSNANYVGEAYPFLTGSETRKWMGIVWIMHTGLPATDGGHSCFIYHKSAVGHASGQDIKTDITWHGDYAAHFVNNMMSQGACLIDNKGVIKMDVADAA